MQWPKRTLRMGASRIIKSTWYWLVKAIKWLKWFGIEFAKAFWYWTIKFWYGLISYAGITAICLIVYSAGITWFYYYLATVPMDWRDCIDFKDQWRNTILGLGTANIFLFFAIGIKSNIQRQFILAYFGAITGTYLLVMGVYFHWIQYPYSDLWILNGAVGFVTLVILISAIRHDMLD